MKKITSLIASIICIGTLLGGCNSTHPRVTGTVTNKIIGEGWLDPNIVEIETADGSKVNLKACNNAFDFCAEGMKATFYYEKDEGYRIINVIPKGTIVSEYDEYQYYPDSNDTKEEGDE